MAMDFFQKIFGWQRLFLFVFETLAGIHRNFDAWRTVIKDILLLLDWNQFMSGFEELLDGMIERTFTAAVFPVNQNIFPLISRGDAVDR